MSQLIRQAAAVCRKDLLIEFRTRQGLTAMLSFAGLVLLLFGFAIGPNPARMAELAGGLIWVAILFTSTLAAGRTFQIEELAGGMSALRMYAGDTRAVYLGKLASSLAVLGTLELVLIPLAAVLFQLDFRPHLPGLVLALALGTFGVAALGTFFSALTHHLRARELLLPLLLFPALVPVLLASVELVEGLLVGDPLGRSAGWLRLLAAYDVILFVVCVWMFPVLLEE